jgi:replicative DNA helicase
MTAAPEKSSSGRRRGTSSAGAEVIIGKPRYGPTGTAEMQFEAEVTRFSSIAKEDHLPARYE